MNKLTALYLSLCLTAISATSLIDIPAFKSNCGSSNFTPLLLGQTLAKIIEQNPHTEFSFEENVNGTISLLHKKNPNNGFIKNIPLQLFFKYLHPHITPNVFKRYILEAQHLRSLAFKAPNNPYFYLTATTPNLQETLGPINNIRMWVNRNEAPTEILDKFIKNINALQDKIGNIYFYIINQIYVPKTTDYLKRNIPKINIIEMGTVDKNDHVTLTIGNCHIQKNYSLPLELLQNMINIPVGYSDSGEPLYYYTAASNILRIYALFAHGGIYCDMGASILPLAITYTKRFDHIFVCRTVFGSLLEGFIAGKKDSVIFRDILNFYVNFPRVPFAYMQAIDRRNTGGIGLLSSEVYPQFMLQNSTKTTWFTAPEGFLVNFNSMGTWRSNQNYGNMPTYESKTDNAKKITAQYLLSLFNEQHLADLDPYGALISNYGHAECPLVSKISEYFHHIPPPITQKARLQNQDKVLGILKSNQHQSVTHIPFIFHSIWLTNPETPSEMEDYMIDSAKQSKTNLENSHAILWTNNPNYLKQDFTFLPFDEIRNIEDLRTNMAGREFFDELYSHKRFANASILLRYQALYKFGGLYADAGTLIKPGMKNALLKFDYIFSQRDFTQSENWLGENIMASKPNADLWYTFFNYLKQLHRMKAHGITVDPSFQNIVRYIPLTIDHAMISGHALSAAIDTILVDGKETVFPMCFNSLFHSGSSGSWYNKGKYGSADFKDPNVKVTFVHLPK
ncbi:MAG: hypothetical protein KBD31_04965 [Proteobacteria bacterium]|nr:hypothetical protein [Pseudomonadota bacterium]